MKTNVDYVNNGNVRMDAGYHFKNRKNLIFLTAICFALLAVFTGCKKDKEEDDETETTPIMTMTTFAESGNVTILLAGSGTATIDWGDGTEIETYTLQTYSDELWYINENRYRHDYSGASSHTITITGKNITHLNSAYFNVPLISLDVSKNIVSFYNIL